MLNRNVSDFLLALASWSSVPLAADLITRLGCGFLPPLWRDLMASLSAITTLRLHIRFFLLFISHRTDVFTWGAAAVRKKSKSIYNRKQIQWRETGKGVNEHCSSPSTERVTGWLEFMSVLIGLSLCFMAHWSPWVDVTVCRCLVLRASCVWSVALKEN